MSDIDITDLLERITGCINNAEYDDEADTLMDAFVVIEAQAAEIEKFSGIAKLAILKAYDIDKFSTARIEAQAADIERLRGKLREIEAMCPVTCDMSVAHAMADVATDALAGKAEQ
jgi:hypothetical protein